MNRVSLVPLLALGSALLTWAADDRSGRTGVQTDPPAWPALTSAARPWAYWWWMGSAVDRENLTRELTRYRDAGMGGVHIVPIYGAKGWEEKYLTYLSPTWMEMLRYAIAEANRLGLGVDMTTGSGWCFGGPHVTDAEANALAVAQTFDVAAGATLFRKFSALRPQALMAFAPDGRRVDLLPLLASDGTLTWRAEGGPWRVYAVTQKPSGQRVKRAGPGGSGWMLNLLHPPAMTHYLRGFEAAFATHAGPLPRAQYHDSYEYRSDWAPGILAQFEQRRGYRLQDHCDALFGPPARDPERAARVRGDYRETMSDVIIEDSLSQWASWARGRGMLTRNQAHGSPGNLLDLYALADIPETEMFNQDRNPLIAKFASSAAHVAGHPLVSAETGTWLREHFTETLADLKYLLDDLFVSGVNHIFYHGTCYSPDDAAWPGWLFYASTQMNPRNSIWRDARALNAYVTRSQSVLQEGSSDNDILLYWPVHDFWHRDGALEQKLTVHKLEWFGPQEIGRMANFLWRRGFAFDYVSDRQLAGARAMNGQVVLPGGEYRVVVVPACQRMPVATMRQLLALAEAGATVIFAHDLPRDVPGWGDLEPRRAELRRLVDSLSLTKASLGLQRAPVGRGIVLVGEIAAALEAARIAREALVDHAGLLFVRRRAGDGKTYFLAHRGGQAIDGWVPLATDANSVVAMDPMTGRTGVATTRRSQPGRVEVRLRLEPGHSVILRARPGANPRGPSWTRDEPAGAPVSLAGEWSVRFVAGGPELPPPFATRELVSWTKLGGEVAQRFAGTALYSLTFAAPPAIGRRSRWLLDLGQVSQSARVRLNGEDLGTVFIPPFRVALPVLKLAGNLLEVEVTNVAANRIRDLDRRQVPWRVFHDINLVNLDYKPFDASAWPIHESGLLGPVTLTPTTEIPRTSSMTIRFIVRAGMLSFLLTCPARAAVAAAPVNIVFILADDLGWGDLGCYGQKKIRTPNLDRLAAEGMRFTDCYAGAPVCGPSRSVLMTGQHTGHTRVRGNGALTGGIVVGRTRRMHLTDEDVTLGHVLQRAGHRTGLIGKWHLEGYHRDAIPLRRGFDEFYGWQMWQMDTHEPTYYPARRFFNAEVRTLPENADGQRGLYETDLVFRQAGDFVRRHAGRPFFLFVSPTAPHDPLVAPDDGPYGNEPWPKPAKTYAAMMHHLDRAVGELLRTLQETGLAERTVVLFASDNGARSSPAQELTEVAEFFASSGPLRGYKRDLYEGGLRVPMIVRWPGRIAAGAVNATPWSFADVMATLAELSGGRAAPGTDGVSVAPVLLGRTETLGERFLYWEFFERGFEQAVRWGRWKAVRHAPEAPLELYDLASDLAERHDVAAAQPAVIARIEAYLKSARTESSEWPLRLVKPRTPAKP